MSGYSSSKLDVTLLEWHILNFYSCLAVFAVPTFVMISGALFLDPARDIPLRKLYGKYIFRIVIAFAFWSIVYAVKVYAETGNLLKASASLIAGRYHMWFMFMITGMYMILPFLRVIAESEDLTKYFLVLAFVFTSVLPEPARIVSIFSERYSNFANSVVNKFTMHFTAGLTGYFLLGHVLHRMHISHRLERVIYMAGIIGVAAIVFVSAFASLYRHEAFAPFEISSVPPLCAIVALFVFFKKHLTRESKLVRSLSQYSFGAYLVHDAAIDIVNRIGLNALTFNPIFSLPLASAAVFVTSFAISAVLNHVPVLRRYIV